MFSTCKARVSFPTLQKSKLEEGRKNRVKETPTTQKFLTPTNRIIHK